MRARYVRFLAVLSIVAGAFQAGHANVTAAQEAWRSLPQPEALPSEIVESEYVHRGGLRIYYESYGEGDPILLLHGGLGNADHWGSQVTALKDRFMVVIVDSRGHGRSSWDGKPFGYHDMAGDVLAVMDHLEIAKASIVGWSDGANIGLDLAINHPERLVRLVAFGANFSPAGLKSPPRGTTTLARYFKRAIAEFEQMSGRADELARFRKAMSRMWKTEPRFTAEQLRSIAVPVAVLYAEHEEIIREDHAKQLARLIPDAQFKLLRGVSHFALWQNPAAFNAAILEFLSSE